MAQAFPPAELVRIKSRLRELAAGLGFQQLGVADVDLAADEDRLQRWLAEGRHGGMKFMERHGTRRSRPAELVPGTVRVISLRMDCFAPQATPAEDVLADATRAYVARYALGRDYHHIVRNRLQKLASALEKEIGPFGYRAFVDSAPVMEKPLARNAGLGWIGRNNLLVNPVHGARIRLVTILTTLPLQHDHPVNGGCGSCRRCLTLCPAGAIKERREDFDHLACYQQLCLFRKRDHIAQHICGVCVKACSGERGTPSP